MGKTGRNAPCPCGSGRKYKRCCAGAPAVPAAFQPPPPRAPAEDPWAGAETVWGYPGEHDEAQRTSNHRALALTIDRPDILERMAQEDPEDFARLWVPSKIAALSTDALVAGLAERGVEIDQQTFVAQAQDHTSALDLALTLRADTKDLPHPADDFVGSAVCELWKRWTGRTSIEMVLDLIYGGYGYLDAVSGPGRAGDCFEACEMWGEAWALLHPILVEREVAHFKDVVAYVSPTLEILPSWGAEFAHTATTAAEAVPESARGALRMCEDLLEVLVEQPPMDRYAIRLDLAGLQFRAGQPDEARASAQALIDANPKCAGGYVMMAQYLVGPDLAGAPLGVKTQALEYARKGAACADAEDWEADEIVKDLSG